MKASYLTGSVIVSIVLCGIDSVGQTTGPSIGRRVNVALRFPTQLDPDYTENLNKVLQKHGLSIDENSQFQIHRENSKVDLHCFNCIIYSRDLNESISSPENEVLRTK